MNALKYPKAFALILFAWCCYLGTLFISQKFNLGFGYHIWPQGEDRNWLSMLQDTSSADMVKSFWKLDGRNPLSAWYWHFASPVILRSNWGLYALSLLINPLLAMIVFVLLDQLGRKKSTLFAICTALIVLSWNFSIRFDNSPITNYLALSFSLLSLLFYCRFIDNERKNSHEILLSLIFYFIAFTTYTLQSGAIIGIILFGLFRSKNTIKYNLLSTLKDASFFIIIFYLYNLIWYETTPFPSEVFFSLDIKKIPSLFLSSVYKFIFPPSLAIFTRLLINDWSTFKISAILIGGLITFLFLLLNPFTKKLTEEKTYTPYSWILIVLLSISLPTVIVESTSNVFVPGDRSYFIQSVFQPILYTSFIFFAFNAFIKKEHLKYLLTLICVSLFGAAILSINYYYNYRQIQRTMHQMKLTELLKALNIPANQPINFLIKVDRKGNSNIGTEPVLPTYANTVLQRKNAFLRIFADSPAPPAYEPVWKVTFQNNGVANAGMYFDKSIVPYKNIVIAFFDGETLTIPKKVDKAFFNNLQVEWKKTQPILQARPK